MIDWLIFDEIYGKMTIIGVTLYIGSLKYYLAHSNFHRPLHVGKFYMQI